MVKQQHVTEDFAIYNSDCMYVLPTMPDKSIDLSIYSPPFCGLYNYSSSENDFSNCDTPAKFGEQYEYLVEQIARVTKPGRITAVHCQDVLLNVTENHLYDFPHEIIRLHLKHGFHFVNRITIWKEPLKVRIRTMVRSLMHKLIVEDSTGCFTAQPDYVLVFKKGGKNQVPVTHPNGLKRYAGATPLLPEMERRYGPWEHIKAKYAEWKDQRTNKLSHIIWQRYASAVWDDIRNDHVLDFKEAREDDDERHVHPLQLDVIDRLVDLYSNEGETVLTPFMGVGSEVYGPVSMGRKAIGIELKESYYKQAILNLATVKSRFENEKALELKFDEEHEPETIHAE